MEFYQSRPEGMSNIEWKNQCKKQKEYAKTHTIETQLPFVTKGKESDDGTPSKPVRIWKPATVTINNAGINHSRRGQFIPQHPVNNAFAFQEPLNNRKRTRGRNFNYRYQYLTHRVLVNGKEEIQLRLRAGMEVITSTKQIISK